MVLRMTKCVSWCGSLQFSHAKTIYESHLVVSPSFVQPFRRWGGVLILLDILVVDCMVMVVIAGETSRDGIAAAAAAIDLIAHHRKADKQGARRLLFHFRVPGVSCCCWKKEGEGDF